MVTFWYLGYICNLLHDEDFEKNDLKFCLMLTTSPLRMFFVIGCCSFTICWFLKYHIFLPSGAAFQSSFKTRQEFKLNLSVHQRIVDPIWSHCCFLIVWSIWYEHTIQFCNFLQQLEVILLSAAGQKYTLFNRNCSCLLVQVHGPTVSLQWDVHIFGHSSPVLVSTRLFYVLPMKWVR
jgi:hypothetical protein